MGLLEMITAEEQQMIRTQIERYSISNGNYADMRSWNFNHVLREWEWAKGQYLHSIFKAETGEATLTLRREVEFAKGIDEIVDEMDDLEYPRCFNEIIRIFDDLAVFTDPVDWRYENIDFEEKIPECLRGVSSDHAYDMRRAILMLSSTQTLAGNVYTGRTVEIPIPNGKKLKINQGSRAIKMMGKLVEAFGLDQQEFEKYRIAHSQLLNQKKIKGTLCLSIHPLDYITMSDNNSGWESCMSWENQGCYRQGTVEMMNSDKVIVAYLEAEKPMNITRELTWNNKKWRELYIVTSDVITNVKGYPYCNANLTAEVLTWLRDLVQKSECPFGNYDDKIYHYGYDDSDELMDARGISFRFRTGHMYNDFGHSSQYCMVRSTLPQDAHLTIEYSGASECMLCGELDPEFIGSDEAMNLVCRTCDDIPCCACCGEPIYGDDFVYIHDDVVCTGCAEDYYVYDPVTEETIHRDDSISIYICNAEHDEYATDWELVLTTHRDVSPALLCTTGKFIKKTTHTLWSSKTRYYIEAGTWTPEFLNALAYNLYQAEDEAVVYEALSRSNWSGM